MAGADDDSEAQAPGDVLRFPFSCTTPAGGFKTIGVGAMARHLGMTKGQMTGHWCSRCQGVWFGYALEVECPQCGNRHG